MTPSPGATHAIAEGRQAMLGCIEAALQRAMRGHARAGVVAIDANPNDRAALAGMRAILSLWQRHGRDRIQCGWLGAGRCVLVIAPVGFAAEAQDVAEQLTRALRPAVGSVAGRARLHAFGTSLFPDDGIDAATLLARAERDLDRQRTVAAAEPPLVGTVVAGSTAGVPSP